MKTSEEVANYRQAWLAMAGRMPVGREYKTPPKCPICGDDLAIKSVRTHWFPYLHTDYSLQCQTCIPGFHLFGMPFSADAGMSVIIMDSNPPEILLKLYEEKLPACPFHPNIEKTPTKILGDWLTDTFGEKVVYQWKCAVCYHITHKVVDRPVEHLYDGPNNPLSQRDKAIITERLQGLGYIE